MWGKRKLITALGVGLFSLVTVFALSFPLCSVFINQISDKFSATNIVSGRYYTDSEYFWKDVGRSSFNAKNQIVSIKTEADLATLIKVFSNPAADYSGYTFKLLDDLMLSNYKTSRLRDAEPGEILDINNDQNYLYANPLWTPIKIDYSNNKNRNITFDGNGKTITDLTIEIDEQTEYASVALGLFANFEYGTIKNLTLINPTIKNKEDAGVAKTYNCESRDGTDAEKPKPSSPIDVCAGAVVGMTNNAYVQNVKVVNPDIDLKVNNANGHHFYVGGVVGKLKNSSEEHGTAEWGIDYANVTGGNVKFTLVDGTTQDEAYKAKYGTSYGAAVECYVGGIAGINISSQIINSKIKDTDVSADFGNVNTRNYLGGITGYTTSRFVVSDVNDFEDEIWVAGLMNNIVMTDVTVINNFSSIPSIGLITGGVYCSWVYNNFYVGNSSMNLFSANDYLNDMYFFFLDLCVGHDNFEALDAYYVREDDAYRDCLRSDLGGLGVGCGISGHVKRAYTIFYDSSIGDLSSALNINYKKTAAEYAAFDKTNLSKYTEGGNLYKIAQQIVKYEYPDTTDVDRNDNIRKAVSRFRVWQDNAGEPDFGEWLGKKYPVVYHANIGNTPNSGWDATEENPDNTKLTEYFLAGTMITELAPENRPHREGHTFVGWYSNEACTEPFSFGGILNTTSSYNVYAKWQPITYTIRYYLNETTEYKISGTIDTAESVVYGGWIKGVGNLPLRLSDYDYYGFDGKRSTGWGCYIISANGERDFKTCFFGQEGTRVEGNIIRNLDNTQHEIKLYVIWQDKYYKLETRLGDGQVVRILSIADENDSLFDNQSFANFLRAYSDCNLPIQNNLDVTEAEMDFLIAGLDNAIANLKVNDRKLRCAPALDDETLEANRYPFVYTHESYKKFNDAKKGALEFLANPENYTNYEWYLATYNNLLITYNGLQKNSALTADPVKLNTAKSMYSDLEGAIKVRYEEDFTKESWHTYSNALLDYNNLLNYDNPDIVKIDTFIQTMSELQRAMDQLVRVEKKNNDEDSVPQLPLPPMLIAGLVVLLLALVGGGFIGVDIYLNKRKNRQSSNTNTPSATPGTGMATITTSVEEPVEDEYYV